VGTHVLEEFRLFIGGEWVETPASQAFQVISPSTGQVVAHVPTASKENVDAAVAAARRSFDDGRWRDISPERRAEVLEKTASTLEARADELVQHITNEMGAPIAFNRKAAVPAPIALLRYYANLLRNYDFERPRGDATSRSLITDEPVGVVAAITPWNGPLYTPVLKLAPALAAGCSVVLKPPPQTTLTLFLLAEALENAGLPPGVFNLVPGEREVGEHLVRNPDVDMVTFTGSSAAGRRVMEVCADRIARVALEMGGKSAAVILEDADLDRVVPKLVAMGFILCGQACHAQTRILAPKERVDEVTAAIAEFVQGMRVGDPFDPDTEVGPLITAQQRDRVESYVEIARVEGAEIVVGGRRPAGREEGFYYEPTVLGKVTNSMRVAREEIFGPVLSIIGYDGVDRAIEIANDSDYGLSGSVWTEDLMHGLNVARRMRTGMVSINGAMQASDAPFGGFKRSGLGREKGPEGLREFLEIKAIALPDGLLDQAPTTTESETT
jgi:aldehyde dehydrogenase (NAD+)